MLRTYYSAFRNAVRCTKRIFRPILAENSEIVLVLITRLRKNLPRRCRLPAVFALTSFPVLPERGSSSAAAQNFFGTPFSE